MKRLTVALCVLGVLLGGTLANSGYIQRLTERLNSALGQAQEQAAREDWEQARRLTAQASEDWHRHDVYLHILLPHRDIDEIHVALSELEEYLLLEETDQYNAANARLMAQLGLLAEMEQFNLKNVL